MVRVIRSVIEAVVVSLMNAGLGFDARYAATKAASTTLGIPVEMNEVYKGCSTERVDMEEFIPRVRAMLEAKTNAVANALYEVVDPPKAEVPAQMGRSLSTVCEQLGWSEEDALDVLTSLQDITIKGNFKIVDGRITIELKSKQGVTLDALAKMCLENCPQMAEPRKAKSAGEVELSDKDLMF
jgi:hypothetical protein